MMFELTFRQFVRCFESLKVAGSMRNQYWGISTSNVGDTDASRSEDDSWSGMGRICIRTGLFWWYQLRDEELVLPIHVTKFMAELSQRHLCGHDWLDDYVERIGNMAVVSSIEKQRPIDLRFIEMLNIVMCMRSSHIIS